MHRLSCAVPFACAAMLGYGCVSSGTYRAQVEKTRDTERDLRVQAERTRSLQEQLASLHRENKRLHQQFTDAQAAVPQMRDELANCQHKLNTLENVSRAELSARLEGATTLMGEKEQKAYYRGVLDVWQSLSIMGQPSVDKGWIVDDHYYTFRVDMRGRPIYQFTVQTKTEQGQVAKGFGQMLDVAQVVAAFIPK